MLHTKTSLHDLLASNEMFVRGQDHVALYTKNAKGQRLAPFEVAHAYGQEVFADIYDYGSAVITTIDEPARTLQRQRKLLNVSIPQISRFTGLEPAIIKDCENPNTRSSIHDLNQLAICLGLDEKRFCFIGEHPTGIENNPLHTYSKIWRNQTETWLRAYVPTQGTFTDLVLMANEMNVISDHTRDLYLTAHKKIQETSNG